MFDPGMLGAILTAFVSYLIKVLRFSAIIDAFDYWPQKVIQKEAIASIENLRRQASTYLPLQAFRYTD